MEDDDPSIDEDAIRQTAFFMWEQDGRPPGGELAYWTRAMEQHVRQLAYDKWLAEGSPEGKAEVHWREAQRTIRG